MLGDKYTKIFFNPRYFGIECISTSEEGDFQFNGVLDDGQNRFDMADTSLIGTEAFLSVKTADLVVCRIGENTKIRIGRDLYTVREIMRGVDLIAKLRLKKGGI